MKTIEEFLKETESSEALQNELKAINDKDALEELLKKYDVNAAAEEFAKELKAIAEGEITDEAASDAAGGFAFATLIPYIPQAIDDLAKVARMTVDKMGSKGTEAEEQSNSAILW